MKWNTNNGLVLQEYTDYIAALSHYQATTAMF